MKKNLGKTSLALDNAVKYLTVSGYKNIVILVSNDRVDDISLVSRFVVKDDTDNRWRSFMARLYRLLAKVKKENKK